MLKYLLISGSPRNGNTDFILSNLYNYIGNKDKELIFLRNKKIGHCVGCLRCGDNSKCIIRDDMDVILRKMLEAEVMIFGIPNYFENVPGLFKDFIDRTHPFYKFKLLKNKKLFFIMIGGGNTEGTKKYLFKNIEGFIKHQELDLIDLYLFQALGAKDLEQNKNALNKIKKIAIKIESL
ncbi:MAG: flavodoxin family protein [Candidatus Pacebacteria bacterium]|nr:flavodoxin family protein [Candidatus Paceibacterota bacterium]